MSVLQWAVVVSAALAATGAWPDRRIARCHAFWPVPFMLLAIALAVLDLAGLVTGQSFGLSTSSLVLGVWAASVVGYVGWVEIAAGRHARSDGRTLMAPAVLLATGVAMITSSLERWPDSQATIALPGFCVVAAGALLLTARALPSAPNSLRFGWPAALLLSAAVAREPAVDPLAESKQELAAVLGALRRDGAQVIAVHTIEAAQRAAGTPVEVFRVDGNEVRAYLLGHDDDTSPDAHLSPGVEVPPPIGGVPHLHVGKHILVVCVTADLRFARQLDRLVHDLDGHRRHQSLALVASASR